MASTYFRFARPVWAVDKQEEMNYFLCFETNVTGKNGHIKVAACNLYRIFINDVFVSDGPARAAHGYYRVDEICIDEYLSLENNKIVIQVGAYRVNSYQYLDEAGFLQCEILIDDKIVAATGRFGFIAMHMNEKKQKVQRYSFQRMFCEEYELPLEREQVELEILSEKRLLERRVPRCKYEQHNVQKVIAYGTVTCGNNRKKYTLDRYVCNISNQFKGYPIQELESFVTKEVEEMDFFIAVDKRDRDDCHFEVNEYRIYDFGRNLTGMICAEAEVFHETTLYFVFDEILVDGEVQFTRLTSANVIKYCLKPGKYKLQSFEPYTMKYLKVISVMGDCSIKNIHIKQVRLPLEDNQYIGKDPVLGNIYRAAIESFCQNAVDIYMDCPSRERAGWLCDSFFTARVEYLLTGESKIEKNFLENYLLADRFKYLPEGMLPMCYPADHTDGVFIPNWAMWLVLELEEYQNRSGDIELVTMFKSKIQQLLDYFVQFENEYGLLEDLQGWVFVEWSKCNELVDGVNYPSNMLYAAMLEAAGRMYRIDELNKKAMKLRRYIREQAYNGELFIEHAVRVNGELVPQKDVTETCQYYAFFFNIAIPEKYPELWATMLNDFGPERKQKNTYPQVYFSNAFIGNYLRLSLLKIYGYRKKMIKEIKEYFGYMAERTNTLWEHDSVMASCNHGFASYVLCLLEEENK